MGIVIDFPSRDAGYPSRHAVTADRPAQVVILPVIRIERYDDQPDGYFTPRSEAGGKRRRRVSRS